MKNVIIVGRVVVKGDVYDICMILESCQFVLMKVNCGMEFSLQVNYRLLCHIRLIYKAI